MIRKYLALALAFLLSQCAPAPLFAGAPRALTIDLDTGAVTPTSPGPTFGGGVNLQGTSHVLTGSTFAIDSGASFTIGGTAIGSLFQPLDGDLTALADLTTNGYVKRSGTNSYSTWYPIPGSDVRAQLAENGAIDLSVQQLLAFSTVTPQQLGAVADGTSHPVSEWLIAGAHPRGYADLAAIQADYPCVVALTDESDWAAGQTVLDRHNVMYLPPGNYVLGNANGGHAWVANADQGQRIIGASMYIEPSPRGTHQGVRINTAAGTDGIKFAYSSGKISDVTIWGPSVSISAITSGPSHDQQATITTAAAHGLRSTPFVSGGWTITGNTTGSAPVVTTSQPHGLTSGERVKVTSGEPGITGIFRAIPCDASGNMIPNPSPTATHFRLIKEDQTEASAATNGGAGSLVRLYDVYIGPCINNVSPSPVTGAVPEVLGIYRVLPTDSITLKVYKWDNTSLVLSTDATANTGVIFTTNRALTFGDDNNVANTIDDADSGREFSALDVFVRDVTIGIDGQSSDGSGKIDHCFADSVAIGFLAGGNIDKMLVQACWVTSTGLSAYHVNRNGGMTLINSGGANNARLAWLGQNTNGAASGGSHLVGMGVYNEGIQRATTAQGADIIAVDCGTNNRASFNDLVITAKPGTFCDFHVGGPAGFFSLTNSPGSWRCWNQGGQAMADQYSEVKVGLYSSSATADDYLVYRAGDYYTWRSVDVPGSDIPAPSTANLGRKFMVLDAAGTQAILPGFYQTLNVSGTIRDVRTGGADTWIVQTGSFAAFVGGKYQGDTTSAAITATLPASPHVGDEISFGDAAGTWATNNFTLGRNGQKINGGTSDFVGATNGQTLHAVYISSGYGWSVK